VYNSTNWLTCSSISSSNYIIPAIPPRFDGLSSCFPLFQQNRKYKVVRMFPYLPGFIIAVRSNGKSGFVFVAPWPSTYGDLFSALTDRNDISELSYRKYCLNLFRACRL
jgi:hypothetical protein